MTCRSPTPGARRPGSARGQRRVGAHLAASRCGTQQFDRPRCWLPCRQAVGGRLSRTPTAATDLPIDSIRAKAAARLGQSKTSSPASARSKQSAAPPPSRPTTTISATPNGRPAPNWARFTWPRQDHRSDEGARNSRPRNQADLGATQRRHFYIVTGPARRSAKQTPLGGQLGEPGQL